jgi:long-chain acyl-CoA synthetase
MEIMTIGQVLERNAGKYRGAIAFQMRGDSDYRRFTFQQVADTAFKLQGKLQSLGVTKGDRVALISENRPEWAIAFLAITSMGAVAVPLDAMQRREEIVPLLDDSESKAVILSRKFVETIQGTRTEGRIILMEEFDKLPSVVNRQPSAVGLEDLASIVYTSGTTGSPKGVMLTHGNIMSNVVTVASLFDLGVGDNFLSVLPLHHTFETTAGFLAPFYKGCTITYAESLKSYNLLRNMQETGVTVMCGVPLLYQLFVDGIRREVEEKKMTGIFNFLFSLSRFFLKFIGFNIGNYLFSMIHAKFGGKIRFFVTGGAAIDPSILHDFELMGFTMLQGYGLTESAPILTANTLKENRLGSVGKPVPGVRIKIAGSEPAGEILAAGPNIMKGYYKRKDLTGEVLKNGWLYTGDVGYLDKDGFLFITGRLKDVIVTASGVNVYPEEIEFWLKKLPSVKESCVLGVKVKEGLRRGSEEVVAVIVPDERFTQEQVKSTIGDLNQKLAEYKRIAKIIFWKGELPKTRLQKVKRFAVRKELDL